MKKKWHSSITCLLSVFALQAAYAGQVPVTMSGPVPALSGNYAVGVETIITYTITNNVQQSSPLSVSGISGAITRSVATSNDCGNALPAASSSSSPATCNIAIAIKPLTGEEGEAINQQLAVDYQSRDPLKSTLSFTVNLSSHDPYVYLLSKGTINNVNNAYGIFRYTVNTTTGELTATADSTLLSTDTFYQIAIYGHYLYAVDADNGAIYYYAIDDSTGALTLAGSTANPGTTYQTQYIAFDENKAYSSDGFSVYQYAVQTNGSLVAATAPAFDLTGYWDYGLTINAATHTMYSAYDNMDQYTLPLTSTQTATVSLFPTNTDSRSGLTARNNMLYVTNQDSNGFQDTIFGNTNTYNLLEYSLNSSTGALPANTSTSTVTVPKPTGVNGNQWVPKAFGIGFVTGVATNDFAYLANPGNSNVYVYNADKTTGLLVPTTMIAPIPTGATSIGTPLATATYTG